MSRPTQTLDLNAITVGTPCTEDWTKMQGDDRAKHCGKCEKTVYNLSEMTADEATELILSRRGDLCVRFYRRADGTMATAQCPTGLFGVQRRKLSRIAAAAALLAGSLFAGHAVAGGPDTTATTTSTAAEAAAALRAQKAKQTEEVAHEDDFLSDDPVIFEPEVCETTKPNETVRYTVRDGDTVASIASQWKSQEDWIKAANPDVDVTKLKAGDKLQVPYVAAAHQVEMGDMAMVVPPAAAPVAPAPATPAEAAE